MMAKLIVRIGIGVIAQNSEGLVILGKRKNAHGEGDWAPPGGHLQFGETPIECALRELKEETGLILQNPRELTFTNDIFTTNNKHYITIFVKGEVEGEPQLLESEKCLGWQWFSWDQLPEPLFLPFNNYIKKSNRNILADIG